MKKKKIFLVCTVMFFICSCSSSPENTMIRDARKYGKVDLSKFIDEDFDYIVIVNQGDYIDEFIKNIQNNKNSWPGEKIYFVKDNFVIKQINISYFASEPECRNYVSFFLDANDHSYYIKRFRGELCFNCVDVQDLKYWFKLYIFE